MLAKIASRIAFIGSVAVLVGVLWLRLGGGAQRGEWRANLVGISVVSPVLGDHHGNEVVVSHPAVLYFYSDSCRFCPPVTRHIYSYAENPGFGGLNVYGVTREYLDPDLAWRAEAVGFRLLWLNGISPAFGFVRELPLIVRTDAEGVIAAAYVGRADAAVLRRLALAEPAPSSVEPHQPATFR
jgi:thiol-disulfide isomerase/thioredoxin